MIELRNIVKLASLVAASRELKEKYEHKKAFTVSSMDEWIEAYEGVSGKICNIQDVAVFETWVNENLVKIGRE